MEDRARLSEKLTVLPITDVAGTRHPDAVELVGRIAAAGHRGIGASATLQLVPLRLDERRALRIEQLALAEKPTAQTLPAPFASTAVRKLLGWGPSGVATMFQLAPVQCSARVCRSVPSNELPTDHRSLAEIAVIAPRVLSPDATFALGNVFQIEQKRGE